MSYTPTTWTTGDTITATKLNKIEQGIADAGGGVAIVKIEWDGLNGSFVISIGATEGIASGHSFYSIFAGSGGIYGAGYNPISYIAAPLPDDGNQAMVFFDESCHTNFDMEGSGGVSASPVECHEKVGASSWSSVPLYGFIVTGNGTISLTSK